MIDLPFFEPRHRELAERLERFAATMIAPRAAAAETGDIRQAGREFVALCAGEGLHRLLVPGAFGGAAERPELRAICLAREALASASGFADAVFAVQGLGSYPVALAADAALQRRLLPRVASGQAVAAFALTEPDAGSDAGALMTRARPDRDGYLLEGTKTLISNAGIADFYVVFARTADTAQRHVSAFVVEAEAPGLQVARTIELLAPHPIGELVLDGCRVPAANRLGAEGDGMRLALTTLDFFRTSVGAAACGMAGRALGEARRRSLARRQFGAALADFQATKLALADMATELEAARLLVYRAAWLKDRGAERVTRESSMAKLYATEAAQRIVDRAVQIHGGIGVERGVAVERLYREVRAPRIYEGTSEIQRLVIADHLLTAEAESWRAAT